MVRRRHYDETTRFVRQLVENIQREDLNDVDRAFGIVRLRDLMQEEVDKRIEAGEQLGKQESNVSWIRVSHRLGYTRQRVSQLIQLLKLPDEVKDGIRQGHISERNTRSLQGLKSSQQRALYRALAAEDIEPDEFKLIARYLKHEDPEATVYEAIRVMHEPLPPVTEFEDDGFMEDDDEATAVSSPSPTPQDTAVAPTPTRGAAPSQSVVPARKGSYTGIQRLDFIRGHLARVQRQGLATAEREEMLRLLQLIERDVASLIEALESK